MKTTIKLFSKAKDINARSLQLPERVVMSLEAYENLLGLIDYNQPIKLDASQLFHNQWLHEHGFFIPDYAIVERSKLGFYLEQTGSMIDTRETTLECSFCHSQYKQAQTAFCVDCLHHYELTEDDLYKLYLRPVATMGIQITHKSIRIPEWLRDKYNSIHSPCIGILK